MGRSRYGSLGREAQGEFAGPSGRALLILPAPENDQGTATVRISEDFVLRYKSDVRDDTVSHHIVIRAGSELHLVHGTDLTGTTSGPAE